MVRVFDKKGSINLAINTIVMVIIGMVILTSGLLLMKQFISGAEEIKEGLDAQTESELQRLLVDQGKKVALPLHTVTLIGGDSHVFGLGILNIEAATYGDSFSIEAAFSRYLNEDNSETSTSQHAISWLLYDEGPFYIEENQYQAQSIYLEVPNTATKGTYIFNVYVYDGNGNRYDSVKKMYVTVE